LLTGAAGDVIAVQ